MRTEFLDYSNETFNFLEVVPDSKDRRLDVLVMQYSGWTMKPFNGGYSILNEKGVALVKKAYNPRRAWESVFRLIPKYSTEVDGIYLLKRIETKPEFYPIPAGWMVAWDYQ